MIAVILTYRLEFSAVGLYSGHGILVLGSELLQSLHEPLSVRQIFVIVFRVVSGILHLLLKSAGLDLCRP